MCPGWRVAAQRRQGFRRRRGRPPRPGQDNPAVGTRRPPTRERCRLLYLKVFQDALGGLSQGTALGTGFALRLAKVRSHSRNCPVGRS